MVPPGSPRAAAAAACTVRHLRINNSCRPRGVPPIAPMFASFFLRSLSAGNVADAAGQIRPGPPACTLTASFIACPLNATVVHRAAAGTLGPRVGGAALCRLTRRCSSASRRRQGSDVRKSAAGRRSGSQRLYTPIGWQKLSLFRARRANVVRGASRMAGWLACHLSADRGGVNSAVTSPGAATMDVLPTRGGRSSPRPAEIDESRYRAMR